MPSRTPSVTPEGFVTFGALLRFLRRRAQLSQRELASAAGYSEAQISRLETNARLPDPSALLAHFVPALDVDDPAFVARLMELAAAARTESLPGAIIATSPTVSDQQIEVDHRAMRSMPQRAPLFNVPAQITSFLGREAELAMIDRLLQQPDTHLVTILGPGGIGKTRLVLEAGHGQRGRFAHGVCVAFLAPVSTPELLLPTITDALQVRLSGSADPRRQLLTYLHDKELLLILDNFEHLVDQAEFLAEVMAIAPNVRLLVSSRERLNLRGEWVVELEGLAVPQKLPVADAPTWSSVQLFVERARQVNPAFVLDAANRACVARLCQLLEGTPLTIELAATWTRQHSCEEIVQELAHNLDFLATNIRDLPARHRSPRAVFEHSWRLLDEEERVVLRKLAVFHNSFRRAAATYVANASLIVLRALVDKSLIRLDDTGRYSLHELIRQYAAEQLEAAAPDHEEAYNRHSEYYALLLDEATQLREDGNPQAATDMIGMEIDNIREGWRWARAYTRIDDLQRYCAPCMWYFYEFRSWYAEAANVFGQMAEALDPTQASSRRRDEAEDRLLGYALAQQGWFLYRCHRYGEAVAQLELGLTFLHAPEARSQRGLALLFLGLARSSSGSHVAGRQLLEQGLMISRETGNRHGVTLGLTFLALVLGTLGEFKAAKALHKECLAIHRATNEHFGVVRTLTFLGEVTGTLGEYAAANALLREALALGRSINDAWGVALCLHVLGLVAYEAGDLLEARQLHQQSVAAFEAIAEEGLRLRSLLYLGKEAQGLGDAQAAWDCFRTALQVAVEQQIVQVALDALLGVAGLLAEGEQEERAVELGMVVLHHPASGHQTLQQARQLLAALGEQLRPEVVAAAELRGRVESLEAVAAGIARATPQ